MNLNIRSITFFESEHSNLTNNKNCSYSRLDKILNRWMSEVRTLRWTLPPINLLKSNDVDQDLIIANKRSESLYKKGFRWINQPLLCNKLSRNPVEKTIKNSVSSLLGSREILFSSLVVDEYEDIKAASELYSEISKSIARYDTSGFANFRFGIGYNINSGTPFFPFSKSKDEGFSVAVESFGLIKKIWDSTNSFKKISESLHEELFKLDKKCQELSAMIEVPFLGMDWSLAPLPNSNVSVCDLIEKIAGVPIGSPGILNSIESMTQSIKLPMDSVNSAGFIGVMLSVLEDDVLANRFSSGHVSINEGNLKNNFKIITIENIT